MNGVKCLSLIESVAAHINEAVRTSECANVLMELQSAMNVGNRRAVKKIHISQRRD